MKWPKYRNYVVEFLFVFVPKLYNQSINWLITGLKDKWNIFLFNNVQQTCHYFVSD